jgi:hypothetical protein
MVTRLYFRNQERLHIGKSNRKFIYFVCSYKLFSLLLGLNECKLPTHGKCFSNVLAKGLKHAYNFIHKLVWE